MAFLSLCSTSVSGTSLGLSDMFNAQSNFPKHTFTVFASKPGGYSFNPLAKKCAKCAGQGGIECPGCKGTGRNKKNGNIFERWKCYDCQGFGMKSCPECGRGGLTPEQRGER